MVHKICISGFLLPFGMQANGVYFYTECSIPRITLCIGQQNSKDGNIMTNETIKIMFYNNGFNFHFLIVNCEKFGVISHTF